MRIRLLGGLRSLAAGSTSPATPQQRLRAWRHGFSGTSWLLFDLDNGDPSHYVSESLSPAMSNIDGPVARSVLRNKLLFESVVGRHVRVPQVYAVFERGVVTPLKDGWDVVDAAGLVARLKDGGPPVILKPMDSAEGKGVMSLVPGQGDLLLDGKPVSDEDAARAVASHEATLVTELIRQGGFLGSVFPGSVNTLRVITLRDPRSGEPFVASAMHRFGTSRSAPTDNIARGGIRCVVDLRTGQLSRAGASWAYDGRTLKLFDEHPDTGVRLTGAVIEEWPEVQAALLGVIRALPFLAYVGWDVAITDGGMVVIEGNHSPTLTQQVAGGYFADQRTREVLAAYGVHPRS